MGYTTPRTWVPGETVDEDHMNEQIRDNIVYLKTEVDTLDDCVMRDGTTVVYATPSGTRVKDSIYRNTSGAIRVVTIRCSGNGASANLVCKVGSGTPPTIITGQHGASDNGEYSTMTFFVTPLYYYMADETAATITIQSWVEWDLH